MTRSATLERFALASSAYCEWCESKPDSATNEARVALRRLSGLYALALDLELPTDIVGADGGERVSDDAWRDVFDRCAALPFSYYSEVFDSSVTSAEEPVIGDLGDDIADIYRDIMAGLSLYREGHFASAEWEWCHSFRHHWGRHATGAVRALHDWFDSGGVW